MSFLFGRYNLLSELQLVQSKSLIDNKDCKRDIGKKISRKDFWHLSLSFATSVIQLKVTYVE